MLRNLILTLTIAGGLVFPAVAQSPAEESEAGGANNAVERIVEESNGNVVIDIPENILNRILKEEPQTQRSSNPVLRPGINRLSSFRIKIP